MSNKQLQWVFHVCMAATVLLAMLVAAEDATVKTSTESPIADMALLDSEVKTTSEKPPLSTSAASVSEASKKNTTTAAQVTQSSHTVADIIIQPLIALRPRQQEESDTPVGRQESTTTTTPAPFQIFGFNPGQGLAGQALQSLQGQVTGWLNGIQLPALIDSAIRSSTTTSTTTTTARPDIIVRVQHRATTRGPRPSITISNNGNRRRRPYRGNGNRNGNNGNNGNNGFNGNNGNNGGYEYEQNYDDYGEDDYYQEDNTNGNDEREDEEYDEPQEEDDGQSGEENDDGEQGDDGEAGDDDDANEHSERGTAHKQYNKKQKKRNHSSANRRRVDQSEEAEPSDDDEEDDEQQQHAVRPSTKRSQSHGGIIQNGPQNIINHIRQLTRGQTPSEVGAALRKSQQESKKQQQQAVLLVNRNGQTIYVAPELLQHGTPILTPQHYPQVGVTRRPKPGQYPQPPLTMPLKRKGRPTQYITIPWNQLGISPADQVTTLGEGLQSQPLILNIPQNAVTTMQSHNSKRRPILNANAVPLLADASLMDIFRPPQIPPSRSSTTTTTTLSRPLTLSSTGKTGPLLLQQRIHSGTIVEQSPELDVASQADSSSAASDESQAEDGIEELRKSEQEFILVGDDNSAQVSSERVQPVFGEARYGGGGGAQQPIFEILDRGRFAFRKTGRSLEHPEAIATANESATEQQVPVQIINDGENPQQQQQQQPQQQQQQDHVQLVKEPEAEAIPKAKVAEQAQEPSSEPKPIVAA